MRNSVPQLLCKCVVRQSAPVPLWQIDAIQQLDQPPVALQITQQGGQFRYELVGIRIVEFVAIATERQILFHLLHHLFKQAGIRSLKNDIVLCVDMAKVRYQPEDGKSRCEWCLRDPLYVRYHDEEWGRPSHSDAHLFEHLILETFQAGLSWYTILAKRENFRQAFHGFDAIRMAQMTSADVEELLQNKGIIRSRAKIEAAINNAQRFLDVQAEFGSFDAYIWQFVGGKPVDNKFKSIRQIPATTVASDRMSKDLKKRGFKFVGSTTCMAYMEAVGMVSDHFNHCFLSYSKK